MTTKVIDNEYSRKHFPLMIGLTLIPKYWHDKDEDLIWVDCVENPEYSEWINYFMLENWSIE